MVNAAGTVVVSAAVETVGAETVAVDAAVDADVDADVVTRTPMPGCLAPSSVAS